ncbi:MAG: cytochrome-c oxidase, cbb3-type subunit III [Rubellimicrobium sp.]|nr:cytochrome-c oxidase, cbb3-type subunit III [Rubellimicrobium sp.]
MSKKPEKNTGQNEVETTGHIWDGVEELNNPLPRWWVWVFYATIVWGVIYTIFYPAWPLVTQATQGLLGFSTRDRVAQDIARVEDANAELTERLTSVDLASLSDDPELHRFAINGGGAVFRAHCSQCHGAGANGVQAGGFPSLINDDWLWGGAIDEIAYTVTNGVRNEQSPDARWSQMPAFGQILARDEILAVAHHVRAISQQEHDADLAAIGYEVFMDNCASCHGDEGLGNRDMGAPNLTNAVWQYGGSLETIIQTVTYSRFGVMPAFAEEWRVGSGLTQAQINAVAAYVHQLGGGE